MTKIDSHELSHVTGGRTMLQNVQKGANDLSSRWQKNVSTTVGGPLGQIFGGFAGLGGVIVGTVGGATHTLGLNNEP